MANEKKNSFRTSIGGQALLEGIMMRGPEKQCIVVRTEHGLEIKEEPIKLTKDRCKILGWPIIRGVTGFLSSMTNGVKAMTYSAEFMPEEEVEKPSKVDLWLEKHLNEKGEKAIIGFSVFLGILLAIGLFFLLPMIITSFLSPYLPGILVNLIEGVIRIGLFLAYVALASKMKEIKRVWMYHGAEHKTIFCYEAGKELTVENCRSQPRCHPRCGTSFLIIVMIVSILVFSVVSIQDLFASRVLSALVRMGLKLVLLPVVVGISYELIKLAGRYDNWLTRIISAPGKALQRITTAEPDDSMLEVAIEALTRVIPEEKGKDNW